MGSSCRLIEHGQRNVLNETTGCAAIVGDEMDFIRIIWSIKASADQTTLKTCFVFVQDATVSIMTGS